MNLPGYNNYKHNWQTHLPPEYIESMNNTTTNTLQRFEQWVALGISGQPEDVDILMRMLASHNDLAAIKLLDYALSQVESRMGRARLRDYLFEGLPIQRNYAALYFKRKGWQDLLSEAYAAGKIDSLQALVK